MLIGSVFAYHYTKTEPIDGQLLLHRDHASEADHLQAQDPHEREEVVVARGEFDREGLLILRERAMHPARVEAFAVDLQDAPRLLRIEQVAPGIGWDRHFELTRHLPVIEVVAEVEDADVRHFQPVDRQLDRLRLMGTDDRDRQVGLVTPESPEICQVVPDKQQLVEHGVVAVGIHVPPVGLEVRSSDPLGRREGIVEIDVLIVRVAPVAAPLEDGNGLSCVAHGHLSCDEKNDLGNTTFYYTLFVTICQYTASFLLRLYCI